MAETNQLHRPKFKTMLRLGGALSSAIAIGFASAPLPSHAQSTSLPDLEDSATGDNGQISNDTRFECQLYGGEYTVMYSPKSQPDQAYPWATPTSMGGGWDAAKRCNTISDRLEAYRPEGLAELQVSTENGYDIVCATTEQIPGLCKIVFTVPLGQNPIATRDRVFENLTLADAGNNTNIVNTFTGSNSSNILGQIGEALNLPMPARPSASSGINLKPFLDTADGGTGSALRNSSPSRSLNPDNFR
ncbi:MAG: COP23 domain-containing protein [Phormidesmis sp.]